MAAPLTLPQPADAPILDAYVAHTQTVLRRLMEGLGDGSAKTITVTGLDGMGQPPLSTGEMVTKYNAELSQVKEYQTDLNLLDTSVADIAAKSADVTNTANTEVSNLVDTIKGILNSVPDKPSVELQLKAMGSIDKAVGEAAKAVADAHDELAKHAGGITNPHPVTTDYRPASSGGGGYPIVPANSSGSYNSKYTAPISSTAGSSAHHRLSDAEIKAYIGKALDALGITDPVARANWTNGYMVLIKRESGGDVGSINTTDSNAAAGHPSQGLTQTIPSTFKSNHVAGTSTNITDPEANIAASMNYVMRRWDVSRDGSNLAANVQQADPSRSPKGY
jgi:hypothetical protein